MNMESIALQQYEFWYKQKVSPNLAMKKKCHWQKEYQKRP